jgi:hypothetical protein
MISSFLHILIVTPVLFTWLRERELNLKPGRAQSKACRAQPRGRTPRQEPIPKPGYATPPPSPRSGQPMGARYQTIESRAQTTDSAKDESGTGTRGSVAPGRVGAT